METMTLREAAKRTSRSVTTLRRYIRSGRLAARKRPGRFGPEYFVSEPALSEAGLETRPAEGRGELARRPEQVGLRATPATVEATVPVSLFQELQMKHEQLLVQYGMMRVEGMRVLQLRAELEAKQQDLDAGEARIRRLRARFQEENTRLKQLLRGVELEQEGRGLEIAALREKVKAFEKLTHKPATNETIEKQFSEVMEQMRRVDRMSDDLDSPCTGEGEDREPPPWPSGPRQDTDH
jgi:multidrug efflux pump subunit AcrA (membrane-fusion protein)